MTQTFRCQWIANRSSHLKDFTSEHRAEAFAARQRAGGLTQVVVFEVAGLMQA